jgi:hypothetical protein
MKQGLGYTGIKEPSFSRKRGSLIGLLDALKHRNIYALISPIPIVFSLSR